MEVEKDLILSVIYDDVLYKINDRYTIVEVNGEAKLLDTEECKLFGGTTYNNILNCADNKRIVHGIRADGRSVTYIFFESKNMIRLNKAYYEIGVTKELIVLEAGEKHGSYRGLLILDKKTNKAVYRGKTLGVGNNGTEFYFKQKTKQNEHELMYVVDGLGVISAKQYFKHKGIDI